MRLSPDFTANFALLDQAAAFAGSVSTKDWQTPSPAFRNSSLGQHLRHILDHVEALVEGLEGQSINYDARKRDEQIERQADTAAERCQELKSALQEAAQQYSVDHELVIQASSACDKDAEEQTSSFGRELQFLISHTVHHFAIMSAMCHGLGIPTQADFGIAPSTLKHRVKIAAG